MEGKGFVLPDRERTPSVFAASCLYFLAVIGQPVTSLLFSFLLGLFAKAGFRVNAGDFNTFATAFYYLAFIALPFALCAVRHPGIGESVRFKPLSGGNALLCTLAALLGVLCMSALTYLWIIILEALGGKIPESPSFTASTPGQLIGLVLLSAVLPGVCEELLFRGTLLSAWEEKGSLKAVLIVSFLFMLLHGSVSGMPAELAAGLILAFLAVSTDSLFAGIIFHTVYNSAILIINYASSGASGAPEEQSYFTAIGGAEGLAALIIRLAITSALLYFVLRTVYRRSAKQGFGIKETSIREKSASEYTVILCGVLAAFLLYAEDILKLAGVLK